MADEPKWTPGPWTAKWSKYEEGNFIVQAGMPSNRVMAEFNGDGDGPDGQSLADAHLIAAAPDLYAALEPLDAVAVDRAVDAPEWRDNDAVSVLLSIGELRAIRAALAKARGEA